MSVPPFQHLEIYNSIPFLSQPLGFAHPQFSVSLANRLGKLDFGVAVCVKSGKDQDRHLNPKGPDLANNFDMKAEHGTILCYTMPVPRAFLQKNENYR